jgi:hypothetical protein
MAVRGRIMFLKVPILLKFLVPVIDTNGVID